MNTWSQSAIKFGGPVVACLLLGTAQAEEAKPAPEGLTYQVHPIGVVEKKEHRTTLVMNKEVEPALLGLDGWSHVWVIWWFDKNDTPEKRAVLQVHPRGNRENPRTGVFACRSPFRPNLIALTPCRVLSVKGRVVEIDKIDAFPGTPILDLKPYTPGSDVITATTPEWLGGRKKTSPPKMVKPTNAAPVAGR